MDGADEVRGASIDVVAVRGADVRHDGDVRVVVRHDGDVRVDVHHDGDVRVVRHDVDVRVDVHHDGAVRVDVRHDGAVRVDSAGAETSIDRTNVVHQRWLRRAAQRRYQPVTSARRQRDYRRTETTVSCHSSVT